MSRKMIVEIIGDDQSLQRAFTRSTAGAKKMEGSLGGVTGKTNQLNQALRGVASTTGGAGGFLFGSTAFVGAAVATAAVEKSITAASDLNEQITKNQQVFGSSAAAIEAWSETTAKSLGISETAALTATGTFGNLFTAIGVIGPTAATMSTNLVKLASDLASFNNASPEDVLDAIRSGLIGEAEPMRRYGVLLSETRVQQLALAQTGKTNVKELTNQEKALARYSIILKDTTKAQGDFQRTSDGLANQQRILAANVSDLEANLGKLLLPTVASITTELNKATTAGVKLATALGKLGKVKIPTIVIPFTTIQVPGTGSRVGDVVEQWFKRLSPAGLAFNTADLIGFVADQFDKTAQQAQPQLATKFEESLHSMIDGSLQAVAANDIVVDATKAPLNVTFSDLLVSVATPGFATGATPADILGPLITDLPLKVQQRIADAELSGKGIRAAHVQALKILTDALDDPRLKAKDRLSLTKAATSEQNAINSIDDAAASAADAAAKDAASKREDRRTKAAQARADAAKKARERRRKIAEREAKEAAREAKQLQTRQFRAIGLGPEGAPIVPGVANLRQQFNQLGDRIEPGQLSSKLRKQFAGVGKLLRGDLGKVTESTRDAINNLFKTIRSTFEQGSSDALKITPATTRLNTNRIVAGLGLDRDTERLIKSRLSGFNAAGRRLNPAPGTTGAFGITLAPTPVHINTTVNLDGQKVAQNTTIHQGKHRRSNPAQKRGPLRNI